MDYHRAKADRSEAEIYLKSVLQHAGIVGVAVPWPFDCDIVGR
jgi:hypothetical protein